MRLIPAGIPVFCARRKTMKKILPMLTLVVLPCLGAGAAELKITGTATETGIPLTLQNEARAAINSGMRWLEAKQQADGHWSSADYPALTALPLWALAKGNTTNRAAVASAKKFILGCVRENGAIYRDPPVKQKGGGLANYNTAICMTALHQLNEPDLAPVVLKARSFVAGTQYMGNDDYKGGMGYDAETGRAYADLSNSYIAYEAMRLTQAVEDLRKSGEKRADLDWQAAADFVTRLQSKPAAGNATDANAGGFAYKPGASMAGTTTNAAGEVQLRSYGSMTYAGLLSLIYAEVDRKDPRVQAAFMWASRNWALDQNPGMGQQGLYYFFNVLAKALAIHGADQLTAPAGTVNWRAELVKKLIGLQKIEAGSGHGYWVNPENRWMEADPVLVTAYTLLALETALAGQP
jgi:squalene-hopene/tetraprenyl-beta-curcumene cyclase